MIVDLGNGTFPQHAGAGHILIKIICGHGRDVTVEGEIDNDGEKKGREKSGDKKKNEKWFDLHAAEDVGVEPTDEFPRHGLANHSLSRSGYPPIGTIIT